MNILDKSKIKQLAFRDHLMGVEDICIPKWFQFKKDDHLENSGFCDESEKVSGAVNIYIPIYYYILSK